MNARAVLLAVGILTAIGGLAVAFIPGLAATIGSPTEVPVMLGAVAGITGILRIRTWLGHDDGGFRLIERERPTGVDAPGTAFDRRLRRAPARPTRGGNTRLIMIRQSLREAAIEALVTYDGHTEESARRALDTGTWTDDEYAVEFFTSPNGAGGSFSESVTSTIYGDTPFARRADRAAREIERLTRREH